MATMPPPLLPAASATTRCRFLAPRCRAGRLVACVLALLGLLALGAQAQQVPPHPRPFRLVNDLAGILQPDQVQALEQKLLAYNDSTSSQIAIVTVPSLGGSDIFSYAQKLFQAWGIGQKGKNNGILLLVAMQEHQARIQTGSGMEGAVPDALAKRIIDYRLVPAFRAQQYYQGLDQATDDLVALLRGEYKVDPNQGQNPGNDTDPDDNIQPAWGGVLVGYAIVFFIPVFVLLLLIIAWWKARGKGYTAGGKSGSGGMSSSDSSDDSSSSSDSSSFDDDDFGGGSSDGGGASGSW